MGEVYLAEDLNLDRPVALKVMSAELAKDDNQRKRFRTEAKAASGLTHPNICVVHEVGETPEGRPYLAMEYVQGETLVDILQQRRLKLREILTVGIGVAEALDAAHQRGIVHRDIKTGNIMLDSRGQVKVLDFGLAKRFGEDQNLSLSSAAHTRSGVLIGTPHYMSPEQMLGKTVDHRTDLFSLGAVLYELITGQRPFLGRTLGEIINNVVNQQPEPLGLENPLYSPALDAIIGKCLEKDPDKRYASARALADDLVAVKNKAEAAAALSQQIRVPSPSVAAPTSGNGNGEDSCVCVPKSRKWLWLLPAVIAVGLIVLAAVIWLPGPAPRSLNSKATVPRAPRQSVAVLPFDNFTGDSENDYISEGFTEEITTALSRIHGLKVAARNSAFALKDRKQDVRKVGEALNVATLLEGSIRRSGSTIRVNAQLINATNGFHLWTEDATGTTDDLFKLQAEIARRVADRIQGTNSPPTEARRPSRDPEAHKLYLQARLFWNKRTEAGLKRAIELYKKALELDPTYAEAHAGLGAAYLLVPIHSKTAGIREFEALARASAKRALELDPTCAEGHAVVAMVQFANHDAAGAEESFQKAIQLSPNYATAHHWYGRVLNYEKRREESLKELRTAIDLDPLSPVIQSTLAEYYYLNRDFDQAIVEARRVIEAFPDFALIRAFLIMAQFKKGMYKESLEEIEKLRALHQDQPRIGLEMKAFALARTGKEDEARQIQADFEKLYREGNPVGGELVWIYCGLREFDKAVDIMELLVATDRERLGDHGLDPFADEIAQNPRFQALRQKYNAVN